ncbi:hypothetical protein ADT25_01350 [Xanthomonas oryzae]|uniref:Tn3 transposase DDE domain-containing protein n=1 Tax=Xanthomonas oryzae TaxID=347 RepID=A0AAP1F062_9XANT|nr:hypothetical protein ADT25_01350 [Xanthomonas oryzae]
MLKRSKAKEMSSGARALETAILDRMPERSVIEILCDVAHACRDIINSYAGLQLPKCWGDGKSAAADGTKYDLYDQNLLASYHIRYGGYGGILAVKSPRSGRLGHFTTVGVANQS